MFWKAKKTAKILDAKTARDITLLQLERRKVETIENSKRIEEAISNAHSKSVLKISECIEKSSRSGNLYTDVHCVHLSWLNSLFSEECEELTNRIIKTFKGLGYEISYENKKPGSFNEFGKFEIRWEGDPKRS